MTDEASDEIFCPACNLSLVPANGSLQQCPHCGEQFFIDTAITPDPTDPDESVEDRAARSAIERRLTGGNDRLDDRHIKIVRLEKQSLYRARTWMLILGSLCVGGAGQLIWLGVRRLPEDVPRAIAYFVVAVGLIFFSMRFFFRARQYTAEANQMQLPEPTTPPDFTLLQDGSQIVEGLHQIRDDA